MPQRFFASLYWKLSAVFLLLLTLVGAAYMYLTLFSSEMYFAETNQRLNASLASHIVKNIRTFINGEPNIRALDTLFHNVMVVNPAVEVYLLDAEGNILTFDAPKERVKLRKVSLSPLREFISSGGKTLVLGDNPRDISTPKVFSAAPVEIHGTLYGYIYVILRGEEYDSIAERIRESHILSLGVRGLIVSLVAAAIIGLVAFAFLTRKLRRISRSVSAFKSGTYSERITITSHDELDKLASAFNDMAATIQANVEQLRHADTLRRELIANVSHDLRTPLASIRGYIETLLMRQDRLSADEHIRYLKTLLGNTERLSRLVEELFELSKLEARERRPKIEPFALPELVNDLITKFIPEAEKQGILLCTAIEPSVPLVRGDIGMIERVLQNLVENALRHTPEGGRITVAVRRHGGKIESSVCDTGSGIPEEDIPFIFNRFYQARTRERTHNGSGLGLAIAKKILEAHGEDITVASRTDSGTVFAFTLPGTEFST